MKYLKRTTVFILCILLLAGSAPSGVFDGIMPHAFAADIVESGECGENVTYTLDSDGLLLVSGTGNMSNCYDEVSDESSSPFKSNPAIKKVIIENGVKSIGDGVFFGCTELKSITIPDGVTKIGSFSFDGCTKLTGVIIPDGVKEIGWSAFNGCAGLTSITIPGSVIWISRHAFYGCAGLTSILIPDSVTWIDDSAFEDVTIIIGSAGSYAEKWAKKNDRTFRLITDQEISEPGSDDVSDSIVPGDVNGDGKILADDARLVLRVSARLEMLSGQQTAAADVNQDGVILADDARQILRRSAMLEDKWYIGDEGDTVPENDMNLSVIASETVYIGDEFDVAITADSVEGLEALNIELSYDKSIFEYVDSSSSTGVTGGPEDGLLTFAMMSMTCLSGEAENYELARFTLKARGAGSFVFEPEVICCKGVNCESISPRNVTAADLTEPICPCHLLDAEHSWDNGEVEKTATCTEPGEKLYTCTVCGWTKTEPIPAEGHKFGKWTETKENSADYEKRECSVCGFTDKILIKDYAPGDVSCDGEVLANDARLALRNSAHLEDLANVQIRNADVDENGTVLADDARQILRFSAKLQSAFKKAG